MKVILAVVIVLCLIGFFLMSLGRVQEHFESGPPETPMPSYPEWRAAYLAFMSSWKKALVTSVALERPAPTESAASPPEPTVQEMNQYVGILSGKLGKKLPAVVEDKDLPGETPNTDRLRILLGSNEPSDYRGAIQWVNEQLEASFKAMENPVGAEGYVDVKGAPTCADFASCVEENPEQADRLWAAMEKRRQAQRAAEQLNLEKKMRAFLDDQGLRGEMQKNKALVAKAKAVEDKARSGALLGDLKLPGMGEDAGPGYTLPEGANRLKEMQASDPEKYKEYQKSFGALVSLKTTMDQINGSLR